MNTEASVHSFLFCSVFFIFLAITEECISITSVVRVHLAEQRDPFGDTQPIGWRLSMVTLESLEESIFTSQEFNIATWEF